MNTRKYRPAFGLRQVMQLAPTAVLLLIILGFRLWGDPERFKQMGLLLGAFALLWLGTGLWTILTESYLVSDELLIIVNGSRRTSIPVGCITRVLAGSVTMKESLLAKGALLVERENAAHGTLIYPKDPDGFLKDLRSVAPEAVYLTTKEEVAAYIEKRAAEKAKQAQNGEEEP